VPQSATSGRDKNQSRHFLFPKFWLIGVKSEFFNSHEIYRQLTRGFRMAGVTPRRGTDTPKDVRLYENMARDLSGVSLPGWGKPRFISYQAQFQLISDQPLRRTSVYRQPRDRAAPGPRSARPSAFPSFELRCMSE
jgi:hypothetical protein